jgi:hypothetical protein
MAQNSGGGGAGRLALILAILALLVAWAAYRREDGELKTIWHDLTRGTGERVHITGDEGAEDLRDWLARAKARLEGRRSDVAGQRNLEQVRQDVADLRAKLARASRDGGAAAKERWKSVDGDLERLEAELKEKSSKALAALDATLAKIKEEMGKEKR